MYYRLHNIFKRENDGLVIYRCFEETKTGKFHVQSKDFFHSPLDIDRLKESEAQLFELFVEELPCSRSNGFNNINTAINDFEQDFS